MAGSADPMSSYDKPKYQQFQSMTTDMQEVEKADLEFRMSTFIWYIQLSALCNLDGLCRLVPSALGHVLNLLNNVVTFRDFSKHDMFTI